MVPALARVVVVTFMELAAQLVEKTDYKSLLAERRVTGRWASATQYT